MTALVDRAELGGHHLVYLPRYVAAGRRSLAMDRRRSRGAIPRRAWSGCIPHFRRDDVLAFRVSRVRHVMALPTLDYSERLPPMATAAPGVFAVNSAHIVNGTLNVNEVVELADDGVRADPPTALSIPTRPIVTPAMPSPVRNRRSMSKPLASLSLDLDNKWSYLKTHGDAGWEAFPSYLDVVVPRVLDLLAARSLKITFFVVGQDAALDAQPRRAALDRRRRPRDRQPLVPPRALAAPLLPNEIAARARPAPKTRSTPPPAAAPRLPRPGLQLLAAAARRARPPRLRLRRLDVSHVPRPARPAVLLPHAPSLSPRAAAERKQLFGKFAEGFRPLRPYVWPDLPTAAARDPGHDDAAVQAADPRELPALSRPVLAAAGAAVLPHGAGALPADRASSRRSCCTRSTSSAATTTATWRSSPR